MRLTNKITLIILILLSVLVNEQLNVIPKVMAADAVAPKGMVLIPAGEYSMGSEGGDKDELPVHEIVVDAFYIDKHEVTNRKFYNFIKANPQWSKAKIPDKYHDGEYLKHWKNNRYPPQLADHPVVYVSWYAAEAYAKWAGKSLPEELQWEKAASYNLVNENMKKNYKYTWGVGDIFDPYLANTAHYHGLAIGGFWSDWWADFKDGLERRLIEGKVTTKVGTFPAGVNNLYDMTGNVWEWCLDWYKGDAYARRKMSLKRSSKPEETEKGRYDLLYEPSSIKDTGSLSGVYRVVRGGSWEDNDNISRTANRYKFRPNFCSDEIGFRCIKKAAKK